MLYYSRQPRQHPVGVDTNMSLYWLEPFLLNKTLVGNPLMIDYCRYRVYHASHEGGACIAPEEHREQRRYCRDKAMAPTR